MCQVGHRLGKSLDEVRAMPAGDVSIWAAYFKSGEADERADWRAAMVASVIVASRTGKFPRIADFMPVKSVGGGRSQAGSGKPRITDPKEMAEMMRAWCKASGGRIVGKDEG